MFLCPFAAHVAQPLCWKAGQSVCSQIPLALHVTQSFGLAKTVWCALELSLRRGKNCNRKTSFLGSFLVRWQLNVSWVVSSQNGTTSTPALQRRPPEYPIVNNGSQLSLPRALLTT